MLTQSRLKELLAYDPESGQFTRCISKGRAKAGDKAGSIRGEGYIQITVDDKPYQAHRLAWLWMIGEWPEGQVDHRNGIRHDNRWTNLRLATHAQNQWNVKIRQDNASGFRGVSRPKGRTKWQGHITLGGKRTYIGSFDSAEAAHQAVEAARAAHYGPFAR